MASTQKLPWRTILIGVGVLLGPAIIVVLLNYYMHWWHPERIPQGTAATVTAREEQGETLVLHYRVDDPQAAAIIRRLSPTEELKYEVKGGSLNKEWRALKVGDRFCIAYTEERFHTFSPSCAALETQAPQAGRR